MKKLFSTLLVSLALGGFMKAQMFTNFEDASGITISSYGYKTGDEPTIGTDPADASNHVLVVHKDTDNTYDQGVLIKFKSPILIADGKTILQIRIKGHAGAWMAVKTFNHGTDTKYFDNWVGQPPDTTMGASVWVDLVKSGGTTAAQNIDSIELHIGTWNNGNAQPGQQGTYYIDSIAAVAPSAPTVYVPHNVIKKFAHAIHLEASDDSIAFDGLADENTWADANQYDINDGASDTTFGQATFMPAWDEKYVYLFMNVKKPVPTAFDEVSGNSWKEDGSQVYFDVYFNPIIGSMQPNSFQITLPLKSKFYADIHPYNNALSTAPPVGIYTSGDTTMSRQTGVYSYKADIKTGSSYTQEIRIPLAALYFDGKLANNWKQCDSIMNLNPRKAGDTMSFEAQVNLWDNGALTRHGVNIWSQNSMNNIVIDGVTYPNALGSYQNCGQWGGLILDAGATAVKPNIADVDFKVGPNPTSTYVNIYSKNIITKVDVYSVTGAKVESRNVNTNNVNVNVRSYAKGVYVLRITSNNNTVSKKLIVR